ncbi:hypothetical protein C8Q79DRAFT_771401 [Trametes meyenii]|nr:hypothetical protein C8Q79DRAFT_771401 [Trametes meyenii]
MLFPTVVSSLRRGSLSQAFVCHGGWSPTHTGSSKSRKICISPIPLGRGSSWFAMFAGRPPELQTARASLVIAQSPSSNPFAPSST